MHALRVQAAAEALELRAQEHGIGVIDLLGCVTATTAGTSKRAMRLHDLIKLAAL